MIEIILKILGVMFILAICMATIVILIRALFIFIISVVYSTIKNKQKKNLQEREL